MSTTVKYKGNTLTTVSNDTKTLKTAGKYMEGDVSITDSSGNEQGTVWQDAEGYLHLDDESGISLQTKSATPSETAQTIQPDAGYYALDKVNVSAISSTYVGSEITRRSSTDLTASGAKVTVPAGYYSAAASKSIDNASLTFSSISNNEPTIASTNNKLTLYANVDVRTYNDSVGGYVASGSEVLGTAQVFLYSDKPFFNDNSGLTVSGATVTVPAGYYSSSVSKSVATMTLPTAAATSATSGYTKKATIGRSTSKQYINIAPGYNSTGGYYEISAVANGSASAPTSISGSAATVSTGTNTLTLTKTVSVTPVVSAGYVSSGTATNSSVSLTASVTVNPTPTASGATVTIPAGYYSAQTTKSVTTMTLPTAAATSATSGYTKKATISRSTSTQYINIAPGYNSAGGYYEISAVANGTAGTPTATKGTVSNHSVSVTPSVTNTTGYITGGTKTGTAVTVSASELVSGSQTIVENGTVDVTNYASVDVNVPSTDITTFVETGSGTYTCNKTWSEAFNLVDGSDYTAILAATDGSGWQMSLSANDYDDTYICYTQYDYGGCPWMDIIYHSNGTITTTTPSHAAPVLTTKSITANGTYNASSDSADGYSSVTVNVDDGTKTIKKLITRTSLTSFSIPSGIQAIGKYSFAGCSYLTSVIVPDSARSIGAMAFLECSRLENINLPNEITLIDQYAFQGCTNLALTSLPNNLNTLREFSFNGCTNLALTSLPSGIKQIYTYTFNGCTNLALTSLPSSLTRINSYAFYKCVNLDISILPNTVTYIEANAFRGCTKLTSISCDGAITTLGGYAFNGVSSEMQLTYASFPNLAVSSISYVFGSTTASDACHLLEFVDIGSTASIAANAFANCYSLETLVIRNTSVCSLANVSAFLNTPMRGYNSLTGTVYVPSALISSYRTATNWSTLYNNGTVNFVAIEGSEYEL